MSNADSRVDILLALRTTLEGNAEALAYLDKFDQAGRETVSAMEREWDHLRSKLERKFSLPDLGYDLLRGFGIGSAGAVVEHVFEAIHDKIEQVKKDAEELNKYVEGISKDTKANHEAVFNRIIRGATPEQQIGLKQQELDRLEGVLDRLEQKQRVVNALSVLANNPSSALLPHNTSGVNGYGEGVVAGEKIRRIEAPLGITFYFRGEPYSPAQLADFAHKLQGEIDKGQEGKEDEGGRTKIRNEAASLRDELYGHQLPDGQHVDGMIGKDVEDKRGQKITGLQQKLQSLEGTFNALVTAQKKSGEAWDATAKKADAVLGKNDPAKALKEEIAAINELRNKPGGLTDSEADKAIADAQAKYNEELRKSGAAYRDAAGPAAAYAEKEKEVAAAVAKGIITQDEATAALKRFHAEIFDEGGAAIRSARQEVAQYDVQLQQLEHNPALSDQEKQQQRVDLLNKQAEAIKNAKKALDDFAKDHPGVDVGGIAGALAELDKKGAEGAGKAQPRQTLQQRAEIGLRDIGEGKNDDGSPAKIDDSKHYATGGAGMLASLQEMAAQIGTWGDQINRAMTSVGQGIRNSLGSALDDMLLKGGSFVGKMATLWNGLVTSFIHAGTQIVADWIMQHTIMAAIRTLFHAKDLAQTTTVNAAKITIETTAAGTKIAITTASEAAKTGIVAVGGAARTAAVGAETAATTGITVAGAGTQASATGIAGVFRSIMELGPIAGPLVFGAAVAGMIALVASLAHFADGGIVSGPGGPRDDRVPAMLSNGEGVLNERATSWLGHDMVHALNAGQFDHVASAITQPAYDRPAAGAGGGDAAMGGATAGRGLKVMFVDHRDRSGIQAAQRDPHSTTHTVSIVDGRLRQLGIIR